MRMKVFREKVEKELYFKLYETVSGDLSLCVVDENGKLLTTILSIERDGFLYLYEGVMSNIGLSIDAGGRIMIAKRDTTKED